MMLLLNVGGLGNHPGLIFVRVDVPSASLIPSLRRTVMPDQFHVFCAGVPASSSTAMGATRSFCLAARFCAVARTVVNRTYRGWSEDSIFGGLGPNEEEVEEWLRSAEGKNDGRLLHLTDVFTGIAANVAELLPPAIEPDATLRARTPPRSKEIHVIVPTPGGERLEIEAPGSITAGELLHELLDKLWLPRRDAEGQPVAYRLESINLAQESDPDSTLDRTGHFGRK